MAITLGGISVPAANIDTGQQSSSQLSFIVPWSIPSGAALPVIVHTLYGPSESTQTITRVDS